MIVNMKISMIFMKTRKFKTLNKSKLSVNINLKRGMKENCQKKHLRTGIPKFG